MKLVNFEFCNAKQLTLGSLHPYFFALAKRKVYR